MLFTQTLPVTLALAGAAMAKQITVQVSDANAGLFYSPNSIQAAVGDTVQFVFNPRNHTVTESSFAAPCVPLAAGNGFNSGFNPVAAGAAEQATFTYSVADTNPHWFYCAQKNGNHCQKGMVGVINPPAAKPENNVNSFAAAAAKVNETIPGPTVQGGQTGSIKAGSAGNSSSSTGSASVSGTSYATTWTVTSNGAVVTKATTQVIAGFTAATVTSAWSYTSNGQVISTQTVAVQTVPVIATAAAGAANTPAANAGNHAVAGMGVAAAAGAVAALLI